MNKNIKLSIILMAFQPCWGSSPENIELKGANPSQKLVGDENLKFAQKYFLDEDFEMQKKILKGQGVINNRFLKPSVKVRNKITSAGAHEAYLENCKEMQGNINRMLADEVYKNYLFESIFTVYKSTKALRYDFNRTYDEQTSFVFLDKRLVINYLGWFLHKERSACDTQNLLTPLVLTADSERSDSLYALLFPKGKLYAVRSYFLLDILVEAKFLFEKYSVLLLCGVGREDFYPAKRSECQCSFCNRAGCTKWRHNESLKGLKPKDL